MTHEPFEPPKFFLGKKGFLCCREKSYKKKNFKKVQNEFKFKNTLVAARSWG